MHAIAKGAHACHSCTGSTAALSTAANRHVGSTGGQILRHLLFEGNLHIMYGWNRYTHGSEIKVFECRVTQTYSNAASQRRKRMVASTYELHMDECKESKRTAGTTLHFYIWTTYERRKTWIYICLVHMSTYETRNLLAKVWLGVCTFTYEPHMNMASKSRRTSNQPRHTQGREKRRPSTWMLWEK